MNEIGLILHNKTKNQMVSEQEFTLFMFSF